MVNLLDHLDFLDTWCFQVLDIGPVEGVVCEITSWERVLVWAFSCQGIWKMAKYLSINVKVQTLSSTWPMLNLEPCTHWLLSWPWAESQWRLSINLFWVAWWAFDWWEGLHTQPGYWSPWMQIVGHIWWPLLMNLWGSAWLYFLWNSKPHLCVGSRLWLDQVAHRGAW